MRSRTNLALALAAGLGAIGSEIVWLRVVEHTVGHMPLSAPLIVACFIVAAGVGGALAPRIRRPWRVAAASAILDASLLLGLDAVMRGASHALQALAPTLGLDLASAVVGAALAIPPALLVGVVLPVIMEAGEGARAYGAHALGAVAGVALVELALFPSVGLRGCLGALSLVHAACAVGLLRGAGTLPRVTRAPLPGLLVLIGAGTGAVQGGWLAVAPLLERPFALVAPAVVAAMLLGLFAGARLAAALRASRAVVLTAVLAGGALSLGLLALVARTAQGTTPAEAALELLLVVLPSAVPIGALVPAFVGYADTDRARVGAALLAIAFGNALGLTAVTAAATALAPAPLAVVVGLALVAAAALVVGRGPLRWAAPALLLAAGAAGAATGDVVLIARGAQVAPEAVQVDALFRGPGGVSAVFRAGGLRRLYQSGYLPIELDARSESLIAAVGAAYAPRRTRALVLGAGSGRTAGTVAELFTQVDVVDLDPHTEALCRALADDNHHLLDRPGVRLHRFDALLAPLWLEPGYDLIVQTVDPAYHVLAAKLYTADHLARLRTLLAPGGVLVTWSDATLSARANQVLVNTGRSVFAHQKLFSAFGGLARGLGVTYYFLVHGDAPLAYRPGMLKFVFGSDAQVRALPLFGGWPPGEIRGAAPSSLDLEPPPFTAEEPERYRLIRGRFHATDAIHTADRPERSILFGGEVGGPLSVE